jgi:hypothetical protein
MQLQLLLLLLLLFRGEKQNAASGAPLARFSARGVTPAPHVQAAFWAHTTKRTFKAPHVQTDTIKLTINR